MLAKWTIFAAVVAALWIAAANLISLFRAIHVVTSSQSDLFTLLSLREPLNGYTSPPREEVRREPGAISTASSDASSTSGGVNLGERTSPGKNVPQREAPYASTKSPARHLSVVSYSLYGNRTRYLIPVLLNAQSRAPKHYPGWQVRVYHDASVPPMVTSQLKKLPHVRLVNVSDVGSSPSDHHDPLLPTEWSSWLPSINPMAWRFLVASDPKVDAYVVRDSDSLIGPREGAAVAEWIESGAAFHVMHDHPRHYFWSHKNITLPGGLWGGRGGRLATDMTELLEAWYANPARRPDSYGEDQDFLSGAVWPLVEALGPGGSVRHNSFHCDWNDGVAFPTAGEWDLDEDGYDYVGDVVFFKRKEGKEFAMQNRDGVCMLTELLNEPPGEWKRRYLRCLEKRKGLGLKMGIRRNADKVPQILLNCSAQSSNATT